MPTTVVATIGSDGGDDHTTIQLWDDDAPASLVTSDEVWEGRMRDEEHTGAGTSGAAQQALDGTTTDATRFKRLTTDSASGSAFKSFIDFKDEGSFKLRYGAGGAGGAAVRWQSGVSVGVGLVVNDLNSEVSRLMFRNDYQYGAGVTNGGGSSGSIIKKCIVSSNNSAWTANNFASGFENCLIICTRASGAAGRTGINVSYGGTLQFCTIILPDDVGGTSSSGALNAGGSTAVNSTASFGWTTAFSASGWVSSDHNGSDDTTGPGANSVDDLTFADQFNDVDDATGDFLPKSGSGLIGAAEDSTGIIEDILENVRPATDPTIGCAEPIVAGGRIMGSIAGQGGLAGPGGIAGPHGGLAG